jgi:hypothetical protein
MTRNTPIVGRYSKISQGRPPGTGAHQLAKLPANNLIELLLTGKLDEYKSHPRLGISETYVLEQKLVYNTYINAAPTTVAHNTNRRSRESTTHLSVRNDWL